MKAVIVDASTDIAVALRDDGQFVKLKNKAFEIGQEIQMNATTVRFPKQAAIAASAALVLFAGAGYGVHEWNNPYSYVSLDASPSIEYALNRFDVVIAVNGLNEDGEAVAENIGESVKNTKIDKALEITVEALSKDNYISTADNSDMVIAVYSDNDSKKEELLATVSGIQSTGGHEVAAVAVDKETMDKIDSGESISVAVSTGNKDTSVAALTDDEKKAVEDNSIKEEDSSVMKTNLSDADSSPVKGDTKVEDQTAKTDTNKVDDSSADKAQSQIDNTTSDTTNANSHVASDTTENASDKNEETVENSNSQSQENSANNASESDKKDTGKKKNDNDEGGSVTKGDDLSAAGDESVEKGGASPSKKSRRAGHKFIEIQLEDEVITE